MYVALEVDIFIVLKIALFCLRILQFYFTYISSQNLIDNCTLRVLGYDAANDIHHVDLYTPNEQSLADILVQQGWAEWIKSSELWLLFFVCDFFKRKTVHPTI